MGSIGYNRKDPAPSRISYRIQRLWLTPLFRVFLRLGVPLFIVLLAVGWFFGDQARRDQVSGGIADMRRSIEERPEFMVKLMAIDGASDEIANDIREIVPVDFPISSFHLDLPAMQERIAELDAVARVDVRIRAGGILQVEIGERTPAVVWRTGDLLELLDAEGHRVAAIQSRLDRADLPLLAGIGADAKVPEALDILANADLVAGRIRGLVRIGERRWDLVLDRDQRIMLPEQQPIPALRQVMALEQAQDLLKRDIIIVDMRNQNRAILRTVPRIAKPEPHIQSTSAGVQTE